MKRINFKTSRGAVSVCFWKGPKNAPVLHWAHANGFNGQTYATLLNKLKSSFNIYAWDAPGYGKTKIGENYNSKNPVLGYARDLEALIESIYSRHKRKIILGGHSIGGSLSIMISESLKEKVAGLILADPVIINSKYKYLTRFLGPFGYISSTIKLTNQALNKRDRWNSFEDIVKSYSGRGAFKTWKKEFLRDYLKGGTEKEKNFVRLSCKPEIEAASFKNTELVATPNIIKKIDVPMTLIVAEYNSTTSARKSFQALKSKSKIIVAKGGTHFFPMEMPELVIEEIKSFNLQSKNL